MVGHEPPWRYGLAEVVYQFLLNNGDLPLLAAHDFIRARRDPAAALSPGPLQYTGELAIFDAEGNKSELDILISDGASLWIGEATQSARLKKTNEEEQERLERFRAIADILSARGALLINAGTWDVNTLTRAASAFETIWPRLEIIESGPRARRWTPPVDATE